MDYSLLIGLSASIPLSILANLWTPKVQKWYANRSTRVTKKRISQLTDEFTLITKYYNHRELFHEYLMINVIKTTGFGALFGIFAGLLYAMPDISREISIAAQVLSVMGSLIIVQVCLNVMIVYGKVHNYDTYKSEFETEMSKAESKTKS